MLIRHIASTLTEQHGSESILIIAPTGISALSINGQTAHAALQLPINSKRFQPLTGERARNFSNKMEKVKILILDEYSMVGCKTLAMIEQRCKEGTGNRDEIFGGLIVYFFGDAAQLPPVIDPPMYSPLHGNVSQQDPLIIYGKQIIRSFDACILLVNSHRQECSEFKQILDRLSAGQSSLSDYRVLENRFISKVDSEEEHAFRNAIRLFALRANVDCYNQDVIENLVDEVTKKQVPVARVPSINSSRKAEKCSADEAEGLEPVLFLSQGSRIMLSQNLWTAKGLVNGSIGTLVDLLYEDGKAPPYDPPFVLICDFPSYRGPQFIPNTTLVPIPSVTRSWGTDDGEMDSRTQFPIHLCYAITIHRSQGLTLDKVIYFVS